MLRCPLDGLEFFVDGSISYLSGTNTMILLSWKCEITDDLRLCSKIFPCFSVLCTGQLLWHLRWLQKLNFQFTSIFNSSLFPVHKIIYSLLNFVVRNFDKRWKGPEKSSYGSAFVMLSVLVFLAVGSLEKRFKCSTLIDVICSPFWLTFNGFLEVAEVFNFKLGRGPKMKLFCLLTFHSSTSLLISLCFKNSSFCFIQSILLQHSIENQQA